MQDSDRKWVYWAIPVLVAVGLGVALYYGRKQQPQPVESVPTAQSVDSESAQPAVKHPLLQEPAPQSLPPLADSDGMLQQSLGTLFGPVLGQFLEPQHIVRRVVVTLDNLPRKKTAVQLWPLKPTPGSLVTIPEGERAVLNPANAARYAPIVALVQEADMAQVAATYRTWYPLFQQAYVELGYPDAYFNDRLVEVIDHLLQTPAVEGPIALTQPGVFYHYADAALEERSAGQKLLIRMGNENAAIIKDKLRQLRTQITQQGPQQP